MIGPIPEKTVRSMVYNGGQVKFILMLQKKTLFSLCQMQGHLNLTVSLYILFSLCYFVFKSFLVSIFTKTDVVFEHPLEGNKA